MVLKADAIILTFLFHKFYNVMAPLIAKEKPSNEKRMNIKENIGSIVG